VYSYYFFFSFFKNSIFDQWDDIAVLVVKLVLRKEIALNRRLYSWFLGTGKN